MVPIKVLYVIGSLGVGGAEGHLVQVIRNLDRQVFAPHVFCLSEGGPLAAALEEIGVPVTICGLRGLRDRPPLAVLKILYGIWKAIRKERPDIVHAYLYWANVIGGTLGRLAGAPVVITSRRSLGLFKNGKPHYQWVENLVNAWTDAVTVNSRGVQEDVLARERFVRRKLHLIYNGVEWERFSNPPPAELASHLRSELLIPPGVPVIGCVANLIHYKGHSDLLQATAQVLRVVPEARLVLVGRDGGVRGSLEEQAAALGIQDRVIFTGSRQDVSSLVHLFDVQVLASHEEGFSNVVLEAMAAERPLVVTRVGGNPEAVLNGETGTVVAPRQPEHLAAAILEYLQDRTAARAVGQRARERVINHFSVESMMTRLTSLYGDLLLKRGRSVPEQFVPAADSAPPEGDQ